MIWFCLKIGLFDIQYTQKCACSGNDEVFEMGSVDSGFQKCGAHNGGLENPITKVWRYTLFRKLPYIYIYIIYEVYYIIILVQSYMK